MYGLTHIKIVKMFQFLYWINIFQEVLFPAVTLCNLNQIEASDLKILNAYGNITKTNVLIKEFIIGHKENFSHEEENIVQDVKNFLKTYGFKDFLHFTHQRPADMILTTRYGNYNYSWNQFSGSFGPMSMRTDFGLGSFIHPLFMEKPINWSEPGIMDKIFHQSNITAKNGEDNGLDLLIDVEQFNYGYNGKHGTGLKLNLCDHR